MWGTNITTVVGKWVKPASSGHYYQTGVEAFDAGNYLAAFQTWESLAKQGFVAAQHNLAAMYENGYGVERNYQKAVYWYRKAADKGHSVAQHNLGVLCGNGQGIKRDLQAAKEWWFAAAQQRFLPAQVKLGMVYQYGYGASKDDAMAYAWYNLAAAQGDEQGKVNRDVLAKKMTLEQLELAQRIFREFYEKYVVRQRIQ